MPRRSADFGLFVMLCLIGIALIAPARAANGSLFVGTGAAQADGEMAPRRGSLFRKAGHGLFAPSSRVRQTPSEPAQSAARTDLRPIALRPRAIDLVGTRNTGGDHVQRAAVTPRRSFAVQALAPNASQLDRLRYLIQTAESRRDGYEAVQHGAKIKPRKRPTRMTIGEIYKWIDDTPKQPHAIGRYQFIPKTLKRLVTQLRLPPNTRFSPQVQDRLADILLAEAGLAQMQTGQISRKAFMRNLAKIWAGFPLPNGRSYYHGYAGNKASMSWAAFNREMARIFPS